MPACKSLKLTAVFGEGSGINEVNVSDWSWRLDNGQLLLNGVSAGTNISLYDISGMLLNEQKANGAAVQIPLTANAPMVILKVGTQTVKIKTTK